jgi:hypothetical protein
MLRGVIETASDRLQRRQCHSRERTATNPCMRTRVRTASATAVRGAAGIALATVAATVAVVATTVGTATVGLVGGGRACMQPRKANVDCYLGHVKSSGL